MLSLHVPLNELGGLWMPGGCLDLRCAINQSNHIRSMLPWENKVPNLLSYRLDKWPILEWWIVGCGSKNVYQNMHVLKRDWSMWSRFIHHSRHNSQHNWRNIKYDHIITLRFALWQWRGYSSTPKIMRKVVECMLWTSNHLASIKCVSHPMRSGCKERNVCLKPTHIIASKVVFERSDKHQVVR